MPKSTTFFLYFSRKSKILLQLFRNILVFFWPCTCLLCRQKSSRRYSLCEHCAKKLPWIEFVCCACAQPQNQPMRFCIDCSQKPNRFLFANIEILFKYEEPVTQMITQLKFHSDLFQSRLLGELLLERIKKNNFTKPDCILPVPLHRKRIRQRGFNQAIEIAKPIAKALSIPIIRRKIIKISANQAQSSLSAKERRKNVKGVYAIKKTLAQYQHVAILDDVMTTGSTVNEIANLLKQAGVANISLWICARAV